MKSFLFKKLKFLVTRHYIPVIIGSVILTIIMGIISFNLEIKASWLAMVPQNNPVVTEFKSILSEFGNAEGIIVVVESDNHSELVQAVEDIAWEVKKDTKSVKNIYYKSPRDFIRKHGLIIQKEKDLKTMTELLKDPNLVPLFTAINDNLEKEYIEESGDGLVKKERDAVMAVSSIKYFLEGFNNYLKTEDEKFAVNSVEEFLLGPKYFYSRNRDKAILIIIPTISSIDYDKAVVIVNDLDKRIAAVAEKYPSVNAGITGMHVIARDEMETGMTDTFINMIIALVCVSLLFIISFRMLSSPLIAMGNLLIGIIWMVGMTTIVIGEMDIMTLMITVVLIGLGVDYSIHILATYSEARITGKTPEESFEWSIDKSASGILTGGMTTALAFFALVFTSFKGFREFGIVMALGIICVLLSSLTFLPAILILKDKHRKNKGEKNIDKQPGIEMLSNFSESMGKGVRPLIIITLLILFTVFLFLKSRNLGFDGNLMNLEAKGLKSIELQDVLEEAFDITSDPMLVTAGSLEENYELTKKIERLQSVSVIDSISYYLPMKDQYLKRKELVHQIKLNAENYSVVDSINLTSYEDEILRLEDNLIELSQMSYISGLDRLTKYLDDFLSLDEKGKKKGKNIFDSLLNSLEENKLISFQQSFVPIFKSTLINMSDETEIDEEHLPDFLKNLYISESGDKYLITFYSSNNLWKEMDSDELNIYREKVKDSVTGTPLFIKLLIDVGEEEGKKATLIAFIAIFILALIDLKNLKLTLLAMIPLVAGAVWMVGFMALTKQQFNMVNILAIPLIIGIGIDDGIHIIHRYLVEGKSNLRKVIRSTGRAVILTSLTTVIAFGSLITARYRGYASFGLVITYGILACLILSIILLPALLKIFYEKLNWNLPKNPKGEENEN